MSAKIEKNTLSQALIDATRQLPKLERLALRTAAVIVEKELIKNTPYDGEAKTGAAHMRDEVGISNMRTDRTSDTKFIAVGYSTKVSHRVHLPEFGSMYQKPQHFIQDTEKATNAKVKLAIATVIKEGLKR